MALNVNLNQTILLAQKTTATVNANSQVKEVKINKFNKPDAEEMKKCHDALNESYKKDAELREKLSTLDPNSSEAKSILEQIQIQAKERAKQLTALTEKFPEDSSDSKALKTLTKLNSLETFNNVLSNQTEAIDGLINKYEDQMNALDPSSKEYQNCQTLLSSLKQRKMEMEELKRNKQNEIKELKLFLSKTLPGCTAEVKDIAKDVKTNEAQNDKKVDNAKEKRNQEIREQVQKQLKQLEEALVKTLTDAGNADPVGVQKLLENYNQYKKNLLGVLENTYAYGSPQQKAVDTMQKLIDIDTQQAAIDSNQARILSTLAMKKQELEGMDKNDPARNKVASMIEALETANETLVAQSKELDQKEELAKQELQKNIMACPPKDRKYLAGIRNDELTANMAIKKDNMNDIKNQVNQINKALENPNISKQEKQLLLARRQTLIAEYRHDGIEYNKLNTESSVYQNITNPNMAKAA